MRRSASSSTRWGKTWLGTGPGALPDPVAIPGELVHPSSESSWGSAVQRVRTPVWKRTGTPSGGAPPRSSRGSFVPAPPSHQSGSSSDGCDCNLAGASRNVAETRTWETKHHTWRIGGRRFIMLAGPEDLTFQALSPEQRGYRVLMHGQAWLSVFADFQGLGQLRVDWAASLSLFTFRHWRRKWQPTPVFLPGESQGQESLVGCRLGGRSESDTTEVT